MDGSQAMTSEQEGEGPPKHGAEAVTVPERKKKRATRQAEGGKLKKYGHLCVVRGHTFLPMVLNTYGGFGEEIGKITRKHFHAKRAEEKAATGQEWVALAERELLFQRAGVAVARGNSAILDTLRHTWSKGGTKRREEKDPNELAADDFLAGLDLFSASVTQGASV